MKYTDQQRIDKMIQTTEKLLDYLSVHHIQTADILSQEPLRWTITTPLYNIGEHAYCLSDEFKEAHDSSLILKSHLTSRSATYCNLKSGPVRNIFHISWHRLRINRLTQPCLVIHQSQMFPFSQI